MDAVITYWPALTTTKGTRKLLDWDAIFFKLEREPGPFRGDLHPGWSAATFADDCRGGANVERVTAMVLDYDGTETLSGAVAALGQWYGFVHTSKRHDASKHRFRAILPLSRPVSPFEHAAIWRRLDARWPGKLDGQARDASRFWYLPGLADGASYETRRLTGEPMNPDEILAWPEPEPPRTRPARQTGPTSHERGQRIIDEDAAKVAAAGMGDRNATLNTVAFSLGQLVAGGDLDEVAVVRALTDAALTAGLDKRETSKTIASGLRGGSAHPRRLPEWTEPSQRRTNARAADSVLDAIGPDDDSDRQPGDDSDEELEPEPAWSRFGALTLRDMIAGVYTRAVRRERVTFVSTCHRDMDKLMRGFRRGRVTILGALTNWGKSSYAIMVADEAIQEGKRVLIVTAEDPPDMYAVRFAARRGNVNAMQLGDYDVGDDELAKLAIVADQAESVPMMLNAVGRSIEWVGTAIRQIVAESDYDLVVLDYLQAMHCEKRCQDRRNEVTHIARVFTDAVKASNTSGLLVSQFKRLEKGSKPGMHDLKESGDLENMAEHVLLGWSEMGMDTRDGRAEEKRLVSLAKNKDGPKSREAIWLPYDDPTASFRAVKPFEAMP